MTMAKLTRRQIAELQRIRDDLEREPDAGRLPATDDAASRAVLGAWLAGVITSKGWTDTSVFDLVEQAREAEDDFVAHAYVERVVAAVMSDRDQMMRRCGEANVAVREHCRERGYQVSGCKPGRAGYRTWKIAVPGRIGEVDLELDGDVCLLTFPGGFSWPEYGYTSGDAREALEDQLRLLDAYAAPTTRMVLRKRVLGRSRSELHFSDGTVLGRHGGKRAWS
ncbi:hypothetical protein [Flexivirga alba]|uniref:Uncharacterized protein n=1 Tax=Flexivirga alba TaxID=702742 RepID=A0ABW2AD57_9MICO